MSAAEDDTELRDLLIQNLEKSGIMNKLKAEMRAAVFLAMEEQDKLEKKVPVVNENLKRCLNTEDGQLMVGLILDFLQVFHLDFTLSVFRPEINSGNGLDGRDAVCRELCLSPSDSNRNSPLLLELIRRIRHGANQVAIMLFSSQLPCRQLPTLFFLSQSPRFNGQSERGPATAERSQRQETHLDLDLEEEDHHDGDSFFDDPLPKPQKTYGWKAETSKTRTSPAGSLSESQRLGDGEDNVSEHRGPTHKHK
uniref:FGFR1 oncogene partner (FOP) N-terminal dimerisation domain-containing protein n=1 Tax=Takifugu rubripes TaxID=31033 RepID=H2SK46_TAKRU